MLVAGAFFIAALSGIFVTQDNGRLPSIWAANAILLSGLLLTRPRQWPVLLGSALLSNVGANLVIGDDIVTAFLLSACNMLECLMGASLLNHVQKKQVARINRTWLAQLTIFGALIPCAISASFASLLVSATPTEYAFIWSIYFPAHVLGILTIVPLIYIFAKDGGKSIYRHLHRELLLVALIATVASAIIFLQLLPVTFLIFPVLAWSAFRSGIPGAALAIFIFTFVATILTIEGFGPIALIDASEYMRILFLQALIVVVTFSTLPIATVLEGRKNDALNLAKAKVAAEEATASKAQFLANMSHEIRTPMNGIIGFAELLARSELDDSQSRQVEIIRTSSDSLLYLLNDILDISKIEAGQLDIARSPVRIADCISECVSLVTTLAEAKNLTIDTDLDVDRQLFIESDRIRIRQILLNLLGNAVKFTERGTVRIAAQIVVHKDQPVLQIAVSDTGIGIPAHRLAKVFDEFEQADVETSHKYGGTGLGLAISRQLAVLLGGRLWLESRQEEGTTVTLELPGTAMAVPEVDHDAQNSGAAVEKFGHSYHILVADDVDINRQVIGEILDGLGARTDFAENGKQAVAMALSCDLTDDPYNLILMDNRMPVLGGNEATRKIRENGIDPGQLPILALTANVFAEDVQKNLDAGMQAVLSKPVRTRDLHAAVIKYATIPSNDHEPRSSGWGSNAAPKADAKTLYAERKRLGVLEISQLMAQNIQDRENLEKLSEIAHKLAGSAGFFGDSEFGRMAADLDQSVRSSKSNIDNTKLKELVRALCKAA
ncbi:MASE1 domain-containing protein [Sphingorhabdus sp. M41]|uniref:MASE1 domain-containing protein n=1 Tax=Sphingorhabdus sp. M41 TaxID=1806885 RepID=UPI003FA6EF6B